MPLAAEEELLVDDGRRRVDRVIELVCREDLERGGSFQHAAVVRFVEPEELFYKSVFSAPIAWRKPTRFSVQMVCRAEVVSG